ncbi:MAG: DEAD/DEAH box helicase family protein [Erythrobacter sp.]|jgi:type III restriction enzyme|nr:DEAD/DEAH box helicase family protein [Erythrobacter sp.]
MSGLTDQQRKRIRREVTQRLSLRAPQEESLKRLADVADLIDWRGEDDADELLAEIRKLYPSVESFEREFPSLCFALATGVGKTRLMGAFVAYLYLTGRSRNFFVLAPNTTIYAKLLEDFSRPSSPKYVFKGIAEFAQNPPTIVTGENWENATGLKLGEAVINIFNVDKINKEKGRIRSFRETLGESYFDILTGHDDLVMLMDEAHRYRAKAAAKALYELKPKLGLELTATPKTVGSNPQDFKNVIFHYTLGQAMEDGFVKEPAVATREGFRKDQYDRDQLERIMLEDGVTYHEQVRVDLELYARETGQPLVHPFMLVVAKDTAHASELKAYIESDAFFGGAYRGRVAEVHSNQGAEESNEAMERLVKLEHEDETDIVIHVNKLKEGWDVTNLFTIVPLRASHSDILTEQTLGRGLRLPYGRRTGNEMVDTLTVIAHDSFDRVIEEAKQDSSIIAMKSLTIGEGGDIEPGKRQVIEIPPPYVRKPYDGPNELNSFFSDQQEYEPPKPEVAAAQATVMTLIRDKYERQLSRLGDLSKPDVQKRIVDDYRKATAAAQGQLDGVLPEEDIEKLVSEITVAIAENTIEIPEIVVLPSREVNFWFEDFDLINLDQIRQRASGDTLLIRNLRTDAQRELARSIDGPKEERPENYVIRHLIAYPEVDYDKHSDLLYKLGGQMVERLRSYLANEDEVEAVALEHGRKLAEFIFQQMRSHFKETPVEYRAKRVRSFRMLKPQQAQFDPKRIKPLSEPAEPLSATKSFLFTGGKKAPYPVNRFDSDPERRLAYAMDGDRFPEVLKWLRPAAGQFSIEYDRNRRYDPDFVVECDNCKMIIEVKASDRMSDVEVQEKARAARKWVSEANSFSAEGDGKDWHYILLDEKDVGQALTLHSLMAKR